MKIEDPVPTSRSPLPAEIVEALPLGSIENLTHHRNSSSVEAAYNNDPQTVRIEVDNLEFFVPQSLSITYTNNKENEMLHSQAINNNSVIMTRPYVVTETGTVLQSL